MSFLFPQRQYVEEWWVVTPVLRVTLYLRSSSSSRIWLMVLTVGSFHGTPMKPLLTKLSLTSKTCYCFAKCNHYQLLTIRQVCLNFSCIFVIKLGNMTTPEISRAFYINYSWRFSNWGSMWRANRFRLLGPFVDCPQKCQLLLSALQDNRSSGPHIGKR